MDKSTHLVIAVAKGNSKLRQAQIIGELAPGMEIIACCQAASDAGKIVAEWQRIDSQRVYSIICITEHRVNSQPNQAD